MVTLTQSRRLGLASLALASLLPSLGSSIANIALPTFAASFYTTFAAVQWVVLAYLVTTTVALMLVGWLGDRVGHRRLLVFGLLVIAAASAVAGLAPSLWLVVVARVLQGFGAAIATVLAIAFVADSVPKHATGRAMGLLATMSALGTALGPSLGGVLVEAFGWRGIFIVNVPLGLVAAALAHRHLPAARSVSDARDTLLAHLRVLLEPLRRRPVRASLVANLLVSAVLMATLVVGPFYLSHALALDAAAVGAIMSVGPVAAALFGVPAGHLVDRFGAQRMLLLGLAGIATGASSLALLPATLGVLGYVIPIVAITTSYSLFQAANNTAVMGGATPSQRGLIAGALSLSRNLGLIGGTSVMGALFVAAGMRVTFAFGGGLMLIALLLLRTRTAHRDSALHPT